MRIQLAILTLMAIVAILLMLYPESVEFSEGLSYKAYVTVEVYRPGVGVIFKQTSHNVVTNNGKDAVETQLGSAAPTNVFNYVALSNATNTPNAADTSLTNETTVSGLGRATGTYYNNGVGNWSIVKTFTAGSSLTGVRLSGLFNVSYPTNTTMLADNNFTSVDLQTNDQITINWTISIS